MSSKTLTLLGSAVFLLLLPFIVPVFGLTSSTATWRMIGQQVMMAPYKGPAGILNADQWDGYASARDRRTPARTGRERSRGLRWVLPGWEP